MMLDEINRKLKKKQEEAKKEAKPKTIGVKVPPNIYNRVVLLKEAHGLKSLKEAMLVAAERGLDELIGKEQ